jgi:ABC-2 type transport system permease protein
VTTPVAHPLPRPFPWLLAPVVLGIRNRARRRERGDGLRLAVFAGLGFCVAAALFAIVFWLSLQLDQYEELGDYLVRLGLSWLLLTFLSFVAFSALVTSLTTFFLSEDLRLLLAAPLDADRLFHSRFATAAAQAGWMVVAFLAPVLLGLGLARCAGPLFYLVIPLTLLPFVLIPTALGALATLALVSTFPARRARDLLVLMGLLFAVGLVLLLRVVQPERLLRVEALPDITGFFATLQSPVTPFFPSFWAGELLFSALQGRIDGLHLGALWTTALGLVVVTRLAYGRHYFSAWSKAQEARKARFTRLRLLDGLARLLPVSAASRQLLVKDLKVFLRDTAQWSQLLLLVALAVVYVYNFKVLDLDRIPYMSRVVRNAYAFVNLAMAAFVLSAVSVRFVFPAVSAEGAAFWIVRSAPVSMRSFLWSKFWTGLVPVLFLSIALTVASNEILGIAPFLKVVCACAIALMTFALVALAAGMGARHPRFSAENLTQVAGSYGGVAFMVLAVLFILAEIVLVGWPSSIYLWSDYNRIPLTTARRTSMVLCFAAAIALALYVFLRSMRDGVRALEDMG